MWLLYATLALADDNDTLRTGCDGGDPDACLALADALRETDPPGTVVALQKACDLHVACDRLAMWWLVTRDPAQAQQALDLSLKRCDEADPQMCLVGGQIIEEGWVARPRAEAATLYDRACSGGNAQGCINYAVGVLGGIDPDLPADRAYGAAHKGCSYGSDTACSLEGLLLMSAVGTEADPVRAYELVEPACRRGAPIGCRVLGVLLQDGAAPDDLPRAYDVLSQACGMGDALSCVYRGVMRETGDGTTQDLAGAQEDYSVGCSVQLIYGCARLANLEPKKDRKAKLDALCRAGDAWSCDNTRKKK